MNRPVKSEYSLPADECDAVTKRNQLASPLLRLPAELRNIIYEFAFNSATLEHGLSSHPTQRYRLVPNSSRLLLVCRQLRREATPFQSGVTYHHLILRMYRWELWYLIESIGQEQCSEIRCIEMFMSLATSFHRKVKQQPLARIGASTWSNGPARVFASLKRIVVTYPVNLDADAEQIGKSLQTLFCNMELEVLFRPALYW